MNKKLTLTISALIAGVFLVSGCDASNQVKSAVEHSYEVVIQGQEVLGIVSGKLVGSDVWEDIEAYMTSLTSALESIETALERIGPWVGADLTPVETEDLVTTSLNEDVLAVIKLDNAVQALNNSIDE